jgi:DNA-directed RNA polymerase specialized sigma24 family protein
VLFCERSSVRSTVFAGRSRLANLQPEDIRLKTQEVSKDNGIDWKYIQANIRCKAWRGYKSGAYGQQELRDIEQSLWTMVERYLEDFTPERATFKTYVDMIVSRALSKILEARKTAFRTPPGGPAISLTTMVDDPDGGPPVELASALSLEDRDRAIGRETRSEEAVFEEVEAFRSVFDQLPESQQELCKQVMEHGRIATQKQSGMTRRAFHSMLQDIQQRFIDAGITPPRDKRWK